MYKWIVFLHIVGGFMFFFSHGASASMAFQIKKEKGLERMRALLELSVADFTLMYISLLVLLVAGIVTGFLGRWWGHAWIWISLALLVAITGWMSVYNRRNYTLLRKAIGLPLFEGNKSQPFSEPASEGEIQSIVARTNPLQLAVLGYGGLAVIVWLMVFKPF